MIKVFLDSSVLLAGIYSSLGGSSFILTLIKTRKVTGFTSPIIIKEVLKNLHKKFSPDQLNKFLDFLTESNLEKVSFESERELLMFKNITLEKDIHVLAGAYKAKANYLVTLDKKHLLSLPDENFPFKIVSPKEFIAIYETFTKIKNPN